MRLYQSLAAALLATAALPADALATDYVTGYVGWFDFIDDEDDATEFGVEYRFSPVEYGLRPMIGINTNTDGSVYGYGGLSWDVALIDNQLYLIPNFAAGGYSQGSGKDH